MARRSAETPRRRGACRKPARRTAIAAAGATAERPRPVAAAARRARLDDAIVSQWLLEQVPSGHRHGLRSSSERHALTA
ncbi:MAG TPA: hypothetical protein VE997_04030 [Candidatus Limnocylindria bacterium]|nr:hypothetical protein [Candidatus Limnocylindria bacterium]